MNKNFQNRVHLSHTASPSPCHKIASPPYHSSSLKTKFQSSSTPTVPFLNRLDGSKGWWNVFLESLIFRVTTLLNASFHHLDFCSDCQTGVSVINLSLLHYYQTSIGTLSILPNSCLHTKEIGSITCFQNKRQGHRGGRKGNFTFMYHLVPLKFCAPWIINY